MSFFPQEIKLQPLLFMKGREIKFMKVNLIYIRILIKYLFIFCSPYKSRCRIFFRKRFQFIQRYRGVFKRVSTSKLHFYMGVKCIKYTVEFIVYYSVWVVILYSWCCTYTAAVVYAEIMVK